MTQDTQGSCYDHPRYYEVAFAFRDIPLEVDVIEQTIRSHARRDVTQFLSLACGPSQHMVELSRRGLQFEGLDINTAMLEYAGRKAREAGVQAVFHHQSMVDFKLPQPVDYAFIALGDLYVRSTQELKQHLASVAAAVRPGGLFLLDWCIQFEPAKTFKPEGAAWDAKADQVSVQCRVVMKPVNHLEQLFEEQFDMAVQDGDHTLKLASYSTKRAVYPQEFLELIRSMGQFEFIGWWNNWDLNDPLTANTQDIFRPITLLRRM